MIVKTIKFNQQLVSRRKGQSKYPHLKKRKLRTIGELEALESRLHGQKVRFGGTTLEALRGVAPAQTTTAPAVTPAPTTPAAVPPTPFSPRARALVAAATPPSTGRMSALAAQAAVVAQSAQRRLDRLAAEALVRKASLRSAASRGHRRTPSL